VTAEQIRTAAGEVTLFQSGAEPIETAAKPLAAPGLGLRHYAPKARLILLEFPLHQLGRELARVADSLPGEHVGIMLPSEVTAPAPASESPSAEIYAWGRWNAPEELAHTLYAGLRALDARGCSVILCPLPPDQGIGAALRDRLRKAAQPAGN
jgi:L-threonylcarbamoyladenylate synthase